MSMDDEDFTPGEFTVKSVTLSKKYRYVCHCERTVIEGTDDVSEMVEFGLHYVMSRVKEYENE